MKTGLSIGLHIRESLLGSTDFRQRAGERIHSFPAEQGVDVPYVTYAMAKLAPEYTKDGWDGDTVIVTVETVAGDSSQCVELAEIVREVLEETPAKYKDWEVSDCELMGAMGGYSLDLGLSVISMEFAFNVK